jgi:bacillithiol biosynthesis deacetylase BshB1
LSFDALGKLDVLAIGAHRDDVEITYGGTVIKLVDLGYKVGILDLTQGEMGTKGTAEQRGKEAQCASKVMGISVRENLRLPDSNVEDTLENKLKLVKIIRKYKPHLVILPYWTQRHPDHLRCSQLGYKACYLSGLAKLKVKGEPHRPFKIIYSSSFIEEKHSFIVDISEQFERKIKAVKCYESQFGELLDKKAVQPSARNVFDFMEVKARHYGYLIGKRYGEAFIIKELLEVEDPMKLLVRSI